MLTFFNASSVRSRASARVTPPCATRPSEICWPTVKTGSSAHWFLENHADALCRGMSRKDAFWAMSRSTRRRRRCGLRSAFRAEGGAATGRFIVLPQPLFRRRRRYVRLARRKVMSRRLHLQPPDVMNGCWRPRTSRRARRRPCRCSVPASMSCHRRSAAGCSTSSRPMTPSLSRRAEFASSGRRFRAALFRYVARASAPASAPDKALPRAPAGAGCACRGVCSPIDP